MNTPPTPNTQAWPSPPDSETMKQLAQSRELLYGPGEASNHVQKSQLTHQGSNTTTQPSHPGGTGTATSGVGANIRHCAPSVHPHRPQLPTQPPPPPHPPSYRQSLPYTNLAQQMGQAGLHNEITFQQQHAGMNTMNTMNTQMYGGQYEADTHPYLVQMFNMINVQLGSIDKELKAQNSRWRDVETALQSQNTRMNEMEGKMKDMNSVKVNVARVQNQVVDIDENMNRIRDRMTNYDESINYYNDQYDDIVEENKNKDKTIEQLSKSMSELESRYETLQNKQTATESKLIDIQYRSMRENLIFWGVTEQYEQSGDGTYTENTEQVLYEFLQDEMNISERFPLDRVHRLGAYQCDQINPRPIVAKFEKFKDKEYVKSKAPTTLRGKNFGVNDHFPKEIETKRKALYGVMKRAKRDPNNKVRLVRDKLFINDVQYIPENSENREKADESNQNRRKRIGEGPYRQQGQFSDRYNKSRTFYQSGARGDKWSRNSIQDSYNIPVSNPFGNLSSADTAGASSSYATPIRAGKKKANSPLEDERENGTKRHREITDSADKTPSPQSDPPQERTMSQNHAEMSATPTNGNSDMTQMDHHTYENVRSIQDGPNIVNQSDGSNENEHDTSGDQ